VPFERTQDTINANLFAPLQIRSHTISNRFVLAAAPSGTAADEHGVITEEECRWLVRFAELGVGLIITGASAFILTVNSSPPRVSCITAIASRASRP
jgi:2,4-dienoyl-CoA reductase-like NADH-dependent reductase (Old Yellow Enzyme family)